VEELEDGLHWFVEAQDKGMWNGVGPGFLKYQKGMFGHIMEPIIPLVGEDSIIWGADYPHPDCIRPESRRAIEKNLGMLSEGVRRKITSENVIKLYNLR
jgi:predicted TIM-barrel fold metal-dependent hydrolase